MRTKGAQRYSTCRTTIKARRRATRKHDTAKDKIGIVPEGFGGENRITQLCRRAGIDQSMSYGWSKEFLEAGKR